MATSTGSYGGGFAQGLDAGSSAAGKWITAYNDASDRRQLADADAALPEDQPQETPVQAKLQSDYNLSADEAGSVVQRIKAHPEQAVTIMNSLKVAKAAITGGATGDSGITTPTPTSVAGGATAGGVGAPDTATTSPVPTPTSTQTALTPPAAPNVGAPPIVPPPAPGTSTPAQAAGLVGPSAFGTAPSAAMQVAAPTIGADGQPTPGPQPDAGTPPPSALANAPTPPAPAAPAAPAPKVAGFTPDQYKTYVDNVASTEQGPEGYKSKNDAGFLGKYQMGAGALIDAGYVKPGVDPKDNAALADPNNWTGKGGVRGIQAYLGSPDAQEDAVRTYTDKHYQELRSRGYIDDTTPPDKIAGMLKGAHLGGVNGVVNYLTNKGNAADSNGTTVGKYMDQGQTAFGGAKDSTTASGGPAATPAEGSTQLGAAGTQDTIALADKPTAQVATALNTPGGKAAVADDLKTMEQIQTRTYVDPDTKFSVKPDGTLTMQAPQTPNNSDRFLRVARVALRLGKADLFKQAMDAHLTAKAEEATGFIDKVMKSDMSEDNKVAALAHGTGIQIYKTADGQYVAPALTGGAGANGQYKRLTYDDIGTMAKQLSTPEGIKNLYAHQSKIAENQVAQQRADTESRTQQVNEQRYSYEQNAAIPGSPAALRVAQTAHEYAADPAKVRAAEIAAQAKVDAAKLRAQQAADAAQRKEDARLGKIPNMEPTPDKTGFNVMLHTGDGGAAETHAMQDAPHIAGTPDVPGLMRSSVLEDAKVQFPKYQQSDKRFGNPDADHSIMPMAQAVQYNPGSKTALEQRDKNGNVLGNKYAGTYLYQLSAINPATGQKEPYVWDPKSGYPIFGGEAAKHGYTSYAAAKKAADAMDDTYISKGGSKKENPLKTALKTGAGSADFPNMYADRETQ